MNFQTRKAIAVLLTVFALSSLLLTSCDEENKQEEQVTTAASGDKNPAEEEKTTIKGSEAIKIYRTQMEKTMGVTSAQGKSYSKQEKTVNGETSADVLQRRYVFCNAANGKPELILEGIGDDGKVYSTHYFPQGNPFGPDGGCLSYDGTQVTRSQYSPSPMTSENGIQCITNHGAHWLKGLEEMIGSESVNPDVEVVKKDGITTYTLHIPTIEEYVKYFDATVEQMKPYTAATVTVSFAVNADGYICKLSNQNTLSVEDGDTKGTMAVDASLEFSAFNQSREAIRPQWLKDFLADPTKCHYKTATEYDENYNQTVYYFVLTEDAAEQRTFTVYDANKQVVGYEYNTLDAEGRKTVEEYKDAAGNSVKKYEYTYYSGDTTQKKTEALYENGKIIRVFHYTADNGTASEKYYHYHLIDGNLLSASEKFYAEGGGDPIRVDYYDAQGNPTTYDALNALTYEVEEPCDMHDDCNQIGYTRVYNHAGECVSSIRHLH